jgi:CRP/FNR family cyclic AMP-dependent transcriptional regulator
VEGLEQLLAHHTFFEGLDPAYLELIAGCGKNVRFNAGEFLCREGDDASVFYVIRSGSVAVELDVPGRGPITIQTLDESDILGWSWMVPPYKWQFDARAMGLVRATAIDGACIRGKCDQDHDLGYELMLRIARLFSERLGAARMQLLDLCEQ